MVRRARPPFRHQLITATFINRHRHCRHRVMHITKQACIGRASQHTRRFATIFPQGRVVNPVDAQGAFLHHLLLFVDFTRTVRARPRTILTADALVVIDQHNAVFLALVAGSCRANRHARRVFAMQTAFREMHRFDVGVFAHFKFHQFF